MKKHILIIIAILVMITIFSFLGSTKEKYMDENDVVFYPSQLRTRDYQDMIAITESQIIRTT
jgi:uncharacterized protein YxeA